MLSIKKIVTQLNFLLTIILFLNCTSTKTSSSNNKNKTLTKTTINTPAKPNILFILCDDLGYADVGFNGSKDIQTPNLDNLAKNGTIFTSAYVAHPFCGPSRASLMTGVYAHKIGAQFNLPRNNIPAGKGISKKETFISKVLQEAGYFTGIVGKWHLGVDKRFTPNERGFDDFYGFLGGGHKYFPKEYKAAYKRQKKNGIVPVWDYLDPLQHNGVEVDETEYMTDALSREASRFITDASKKDNPFFLYLSYNAPHTPLEAKEEDLKLFQHIKDKKRKTYAAMVYAVDRGVKNIVNALKESGQYENTLIVFLSDNGGKLTAGGNNYPLREGKGSTCEGGYRTPMFFHWPNVVPKEKKFNYIVTALDFYPTFVRLAGAKIPEGKNLDGKNIWDNFLAGIDSHKDESIFVLRHRIKWSDVGIRKNQWKALKIYNQKWRLYNLDKDIGEKNDLSSIYPEILHGMVKDAALWGNTHKQPKWWHNKQTGIQWEEENMPHFEKTFKID